MSAFESAVDVADETTTLGGLARGQVPNVAAVAECADIARAAAYRDFPTHEAPCSRPRQRT